MMDATHYGRRGHLYSINRAILTAFDDLVVNNNIACKRNTSNIERDLRLVMNIIGEFVIIHAMCFRFTAP